VGHFLLAGDLLDDAARDAGEGADLVSRVLPSGVRLPVRKPSPASYRTEERHACKTPGKPAAEIKKDRPENDYE
jgi:hypothetical protein